MSCNLRFVPILLGVTACLESSPQPSPGKNDAAADQDTGSLFDDTSNADDLFQTDTSRQDLVPWDFATGEGQDDLDVEQDLAPEVWTPPPTAPYNEPELVPVERYLVAYIADPAKDRVGPRLDAGTFQPPAGPGVDFYGVEWYERIPEEGGKLGYAGYGLFYAVTTVVLEEPANLLIRADRFYQTYVNNRPQPADVYESRLLRTPAPGIVGTNVIVGMAYIAGNDPELEIYKTPDEAYFNLLDTTSPDLLVGDSSEQWVGVTFLNLTDHVLSPVTARVVGSDYFLPSEETYPAMAPASMTQLAFRLIPKAAPSVEGQVWMARLRVEAPGLEWSYETNVGFPTVQPGKNYRHTRRSAIDNSVQYVAINPASGTPPAQGHALVLALHEAGVDAEEMAGYYAQKEWAYIVAPTNRRPYGFDWEEWGRLDGIEALDDALATLPVDPTRVYVTGHSMGGHGAWQFGVLYPDRFRVVGPSSAWATFFSFGGEVMPTGPFARARASSFTLNYVSNLGKQAVYMLHGDADDGVPMSEAELMAEAVEPVAQEFYFHIQPGGGHFWDGDLSAGVDCVDWPELFTWMQERTLEPTPLDFSFKTPSPWINPTYSYVTILSQTDPYHDSTITSVAAGTDVALTTDNVRGMTLDGSALIAAGVTSLTVDSSTVALSQGPISWGAQEGKTPSLQGPMNQVYQRPFCYVYPDETDSVPRRYASFMVSSWSELGNGHACALPLAKLTPELRKNYNIIYVGIPRESVPVPEGIPFSWDTTSVTVDDYNAPAATLLFVFPEEGHLSAVVAAADAAWPLIYWNYPWGSRAGLPDWIGWTEAGAFGAGFFDGNWTYQKSLAAGLQSPLTDPWQL